MDTKQSPVPTLDPTKAKHCRMYEPIENTCNFLDKDGVCHESPEGACPCPCTMAWTLEHITSPQLKVTPGPKYDSVKPQYSLLPLDLLLQWAPHKPTGELLDLKHIIHECHNIINTDFGSAAPRLIKAVTEYLITCIGLAPLCTALQYGVVKYYKNSWKQGFNGDYRRLLESTIRHTLAIMHGEEYDGEIDLKTGKPYPGFPKGNMHLGAVQFSLMVAYNEAVRFHEGEPAWPAEVAEPKKKSSDSVDAMRYFVNALATQPQEG